MRLKRKQVDDVLGGDEMWAHADRTQGMTGLTVDGRGNLLTLPFQLASCDKCNFDSAFYYQLQIRSADEPMTTCAISIIPDFLILLTSGKCKVYR
jgi:DNA-directed RNA polymerase III subunit RPC11